MLADQTEIYRPRAVSDLGTWAIEPLHFKVYGLLATGKEVTDNMLHTAKQFVGEEVLQRVADMGESNDLGFVIIHPGDIGISIAVHWWAQGSVLCQHIYRKAYGDSAPMDTVSRPVIACVWELALINAEQEAWRSIMMCEAPDRAAYLCARAQFDVA
ncbi:MAG: hypothetical protein K5905_03780 [Roseibium sp.]|uniref:hypothetical protein n=1 Tax=Roseibium sp. TaxID=1936156 RepID=UPI0026234F18|nr:hypothetical protein [Roseibium sp.]MCV0424570.1 hypothetical protein [Roseibium sp.]